MRGSQTDLLDAFLTRGYLSPESLKLLKARAARKEVPVVGEGLVSGILHSDAKGWILADALGIPFLEIDPAAVPLSLSELIPEAIARENMTVPVSRETGRLTLAVADPFRHGVFSRIEEMTGLGVSLVICPGSTITRILERLYPETLPISHGEILSGTIPREEAREWLARGRGRLLAEKILLHAVETGISTVRICPSGRNTVIFGDSGEKRTLLLSFPIRFRETLVGAFADLAGLPPGRECMVEATFRLETDTGIHAFRISLLRGLSGIETVITVIPDLRSVIPLHSIGFHPEQAEAARRFLSMRDGLILVSSPSSEGVATTIYAMLRESYRAGARVVTIEETHRFRNDGYIQLERHEVEKRFGGGWTRLADTLQPDALMIEAVSCKEELLDLVHLARRGIPVFCAVRGESLSRTLAALFSLDVDPFLLVRVVRLVMHQRLVDLLCPECRRAVPAVPSLALAGEGYRGRLETMIQEVSFYVRAGCPRCRETGYAGKMALFDMLPFTPGVQKQILSDGPLEERLAQIIDQNFLSAFPSVEDLLRRGMVTFDDVLPYFR